MNELVNALRAALACALAVWTAAGICIERSRAEGAPLLSLELGLRAVIGLALVALGELFVPGDFALFLLRGDSGTMFSWYALWTLAAALFHHAPTLRRFTAAWLPETETSDIQEGSTP